MNYQGPGLYQHYKGYEYEVLGLALQEDTVTKLDESGRIAQVGLGHDEVTFVIYRPLSPGSMLETREESFWAREWSDFNAQVEGPEVEIGGAETVPRFHKIGPVPEQ